MTQLDDAERRAIWHDNALRVYRIALDTLHGPAGG
ncbi:amidohydrolase, partial [Alcaligenes phenolicus]